MKPSNTYHNEVSFNGILQPLVDLLSQSPRQGESLIGQEVVMHGVPAKAIIAIDSENDIHLLISPAPINRSQLQKLDLRGLKIEIKNWAVAKLPAQQYLDLSCSTGSLPSFKRPFLKFSEDVLYEIERAKIEPASAVYRTCIRWRKFWSPDIQTDVTKEWLHGIFGELLFLNETIDKFGNNIISHWEGPLGSDHDFQTGNELAVEIKTSTETPFNIHCNIHQLDYNLFKELFVVCYKLNYVENGKKLTELVKNIEANLASNEQLLDIFYDKLSASGYRRQLEAQYDEHSFEYSQAAVFKVDSLFPKITESSFVTPPDHRISSIRYCVQIVGVKEMSLDDISNELKKFQGHDKQ